jgi:hypothetical protein
MDLTLRIDSTRFCYNASSLSVYESPQRCIPVDFFTRSEWQDACEWWFGKGIWGAGDLRTVAVKGSRSLCPDSITGSPEYETGMSETTWFFIPRKCLPHVRLTQRAGHFEISCCEDHRILSYLRYKIMWSCYRLQNKTASSELPINMNYHFSGGNASFTTFWNRGWYTLTLIFNLIFP